MYTLTVEVLKKDISKNEEAKIVSDALKSKALDALLRLFDEKISISTSKGKDIVQGKSAIIMRDEETNEEIYRISLSGKESKTQGDI